MLVLTRSLGKDTAVKIADNITLQIVDSKKGRQTVGLALLTTSPITIRREELPVAEHIAPKMGNLVLTRKKGESVIVGDNIKITVVEASKSATKVGIDAPKEIPILRVEAKSIDPDSLDEI